MELSGVTEVQLTAGEKLVLGQLIEITGMTGGVGETFEGNCKAVDSPSP